jgi:hypothetical protein
MCFISKRDIPVTTSFTLSEYFYRWDSFT